MTKADIVNEIAKTTGIDKPAVLSVVEQFMAVVKDRPQHQQEHYDRNPGSQHPGIQTSQLFQRGNR